MKSKETKARSSMMLSKATAFAVVIMLATISTGSVSGQAAPMHGQLVLAAGTSTSWEAYVFRPSVTYDGASFKMWYTGEDNSSFAYDNIGLASSGDGVAWTRQQGNPVFKRGAAGQWDAGSVDNAWVLFEANEYKMWYTGYNTVYSQASIGFATSTDGVSWTRYSGNPVLSPSPPSAWDDAYVALPSVIRTASGYSMYYRGTSAGVGHTGLATSEDGIHWTKKGVVNIPRSGWDAYYTQYVSGIMTVGDEFVVGYSGYPGKANAGTQIGFASSQDGVHWTAYAGNPVITYGTDPKGWDQAIGIPMALSVGSDYYVYYTGWNGSTDQIGLAILPSAQYPIPEYTSGASVMIMIMLTAMAALSRHSKARKHLS